MQSNTFFSNTQVNQGFGFFGTGLFYNVIMPGIGNLILGSAFYLPSMIGSLVLSPFFVGLNLWLGADKDKSKSKYSKISVIQEHILLSVYVLSSAVVGSLILGQFALGAILASSVGIAVVYATMLAIYSLNQALKKFNPPTRQQNGDRVSPFAGLPTVHMTLKRSHEI